MTPEREAEARALIALAEDTLDWVRVFVTSRQKVKHPEGIELYDERLAKLRAWLAAEEREDEL